MDIEKDFSFRNQWDIENKNHSQPQHNNYCHDSM